MNKYYKNIDGGYIAAIGTGAGDVEITKEEYESILSVIRSRPIPEPGYDYRLREDLTWELVEVPPREGAEISGDEFMAMLEEVL